MDTVLDRVCWNHPTSCPAFISTSLVFWWGVCTGYSGCMMHGWPDSFSNAHGALSLLFSLHCPSTMWNAVSRPPSCWDCRRRRQMKILHSDYEKTKIRLRDDQSTQPHSTRHITISATAAARSSVDGVLRTSQSEFRQYLQITLPWTAADGVFTTILGGKSSRPLWSTASV